MKKKSFRSFLSFHIYKIIVFFYTMYEIVHTHLLGEWNHLSIHSVLDRKSIWNLLSLHNLMNKVLRWWCKISHAYRMKMKRNQTIFSFKQSLRPLQNFYGMLFPFLQNRLIHIHEDDRCSSRTVHHVYQTHCLVFFKSYFHHSGVFSIFDSFTMFPFEWSNDVMLYTGSV